MNKQEKIYIAGNTGLVGSAICRKLTEYGFTNQVYTPYPQYDLRDQKQVMDFYAREHPDYVFVAAAKVGGILANSTYPAEFLYDNLIIEANLINAAHVYGVKKLLFLGSSCIYPRLCPQPIKEEYLLTSELEETNEPYAIAKIAGIKMCQYYRKQYGDDFISVMPTNLFGPGDNYHLEHSHVLPAMIRKMYLAKLLMEERLDVIRQNFVRHEGKEMSDIEIINTLSHHGIQKEGSTAVLSLWGTGSPKREFLYVEDLADCLMHLMQTYSSEMHINAGTGKDMTIREIAALIKHYLGYEGEISWDHSKPDGTPQKLLDVSRLGDTGWKPRFGFKRAVEMTIKDYISYE